MRTSGKSIRKNYSPVALLLYALQKKGKYIRSVIAFFTFFCTENFSILCLVFYSLQIRQMHKGKLSLKMWKPKCTIHITSAVLSQCKILLQTSQIKYFVGKCMQDWLWMTSMHLKRLNLVQGQMGSYKWSDPPSRRFRRLWYTEG